MTRSALLRISLALTLAACGLDVVGIVPAGGSPDGGLDAAPGSDGGPSPEPDAQSEADASEGGADGGDSGAPDANPCAECPAGTDRAQCVQQACLTGRRVFVTSGKWQGNLGGTDGADTKCTDAANAKGFGGRWRAWLSTSSSSVTSRFNHDNGPFRLLDGTVLAEDWNGLTDGAISTPIAIDENGTRITANDGSEAWTATNWDASGVNFNCSSFNSNSSSTTAYVGLAHVSNNAWSLTYLKNCDSNLRLYCFEQ